MSRSFRKKPARSKNTYSYILREKGGTKKRKPHLHSADGSLLFLWNKHKNMIRGALLGVLIFCGTAGIFFFSQFFDIQEITLTRKDFGVNTQGVSKFLSQFYGENIVLLSKKTLTHNLQKKFPEIENIEIRKQFPRSVALTLYSYPVIAKWQFQYPADTFAPIAANEPSTTELSHTVFINTLGQQSPSAPENEDFFTIFEEIPTASAPILTKRQIIDSEQLEQIVSGKENLEALTPFTISAAKFFRDAQEVHFITANGPVFWVDFGVTVDNKTQQLESFAEQIAKIAALTTKTEFFQRPLSYVDLRIPQKIIYLEKDE